MVITYCSTYYDILRCSLYSMSHRRELLFILSLPIISGTFKNGHNLMWMGWIGFPVAALLWTLATGLIVGLTLNVLIFCRLLIPRSKRVCTTTLTPEGFTDVTLRKTKSFPWSAFSEIRFHQGDILLWRKGKDGMFIPRSAFADLSQAREFYRQNVSLWNAAKYSSAVSVSQDETVWPPAPRV